MARTRKTEKDILCPLEYGLDVFGGKWKSRIICVLVDGPLRYSEIRHDMTNVTDAALAGALKELIANGLVHREQFEEIPPRVEYSLTEKGASVVPVLQHICQWSGIFYRESLSNGAQGEEIPRLAKCEHCDYRG